MDPLLPKPEPGKPCGSPAAGITRGAVGRGSWGSAEECELCSAASPAHLDCASPAPSGPFCPAGGSQWIHSHFVMGQVSEHRNVLSDPRDLLGQLLCSDTFAWQSKELMLGFVDPPVQGEVFNYLFGGWPAG